MKVILQQDIKGKGKKGQLVNVSDGYARNYLLPKGLAVEANAANINVMNIQKASKEHHLDNEKQTAKELAGTLLNLRVNIGVKAGEGGRLFGSVTSKEIAESLKEKHGIEIDRRKIMLDSPIKSYGSYEIIVKLYPEITASFIVDVGDEN